MCSIPDRLDLILVPESRHTVCLIQNRKDEEKEKKSSFSNMSYAYLCTHQKSPFMLKN